MDQTLSKTDYIACYVDIIRGLIMCNDLKGTAHSAQDKFWGFTFFKAYISFWYRKKTHAQCLKWEEVGEAEVLTFWSKLIFWSNSYFCQDLRFYQNNIFDNFIKKSWSFDQIYVFLNLIISSMIDDITPFCSSKV